MGFGVGSQLRWRRGRRERGSQLPLRHPPLKQNPLSPRSLVRGGRSRPYKEVLEVNFLVTLVELRLVLEAELLVPQKFDPMDDRLFLLATVKSVARCDTCLKYPIAHVLHYSATPPRAQLCTRSCSNKQQQQAWRAQSAETACAAMHKSVRCLLRWRRMAVSGQV